MLVRFIEMIEKNAEQMAGEMKEKLVTDPATQSYKTVEDSTLYENIFEVYSRLGHWLIKDSEKGELPAHYTAMGEQRFAEGFPLHEVIQATVATKRHIWDTIIEKGIMRTPKELDTAVDFITYLNRFFDMAMYYTALGYYRALHAKTAR
jgi:hypothetical protein